MLCQATVDHAVRNAVISRLDVGLDRGTRVLSLMDDFAARYLFDDLGQVLETGKPRRYLLDRFYRGGRAWASEEHPQAWDSAEHTKAADTIRELHRLLLELQGDFMEVSNQVYAAHLKDAFYKADVAMNKASSLLVNTRVRLEQVAAELECCRIKHVTLPRTEMVTWLRAVIVFLVAACLVFIFTVQVRGPRNLPLTLSRRLLHPHLSRMPGCAPFCLARA